MKITTTNRKQAPQRGFMTEVSYFGSLSRTFSAQKEHCRMIIQYVILEGLRFRIQGLSMIEV